MAVKRTPDPTNTQRVRETRAMYVSLRLCPYCYGQRHAEPGREGCRPCLDARNARYRERRRARLAAGICYKCLGPLDTAGTMCAACAAKQNARIQRHYRTRVAAGRCRCGLATLPGQTLCPACAADNRERNTARYREQQARRPKCRCATVRVRRLRLYDAEFEGRPLALWFQWCPRCRRIETHRMWVDPARVREVVGWGLRTRPEGE